MSDAPRARTSTFHILTAGYYQQGVASTVALIRDGAVTVVVDPGMVSNRSLILDPLAALGVAPDQVTDVVSAITTPITRSTPLCSRRPATTIIGRSIRMTGGRAATPRGSNCHRRSS
jgi:hypothetical protein